MNWKQLLIFSIIIENSWFDTFEKKFFIKTENFKFQKQFREKQSSIAMNKSN